MNNVWGLVASLVCLAIVAVRPAGADDTTIQFLIPGDVGSGWDVGARAVGSAMVESGIIKTAVYTNLEGASGGRALMALSQGGPAMNHTLMIESAALIIQSVGGQTTRSFRDAVPIGALYADHEAVVVSRSSGLQSVPDLVRELATNPKSAISIAAGPWSVDRVIAAKIYETAGGTASALRFQSHGSGQAAIDELIQARYSSVVALVAGLGVVLPDVRAGKLRLIAVSSEHRLPGIDAPTLREAGIDFAFTNWRGFSAAPGTSRDQIALYQDYILALSTTPAWRKILADHVWDDFVLTGPAFVRFLGEQESMTRKLLSGE